MKPTPHLEKLTATLANDKLPATDRPRIEAAKARYRDWIDAMSKVQGPSDVALSALVSLLDEYKRYIDLNLIFDSPEDFLYRQKGQLKLDNSIIEEFLPWLLAPPVCDKLPGHFSTGPTTCYSAIYFESSLRDERPGAGIRLRTKDQDFAISRRLFIRASHHTDFFWANLPAMASSCFASSTPKAIISPQMSSTRTGTSPGWRRWPGSAFC